MLLTPMAPALGVSGSVLSVLLTHVVIQVALSVAQVGQQALLPDLVPGRLRGTAAGLKGFINVGGAMLGFVMLGQLLGGGRTGQALVAVVVVLIVTFLLTFILVREARIPRAPLAGRATIVDTLRLDLHTHREFAWPVASRFLFLLGAYATGQFFLYLVADRLSLDRDRAAEQAGMQLGGLALVTVLAALPDGWAADHLRRMPLMLAGAALSALGSLMALGTVAFTAANWAFTADVAPPAEAARFFGPADIGTAGSAATAGLLGPLVDWVNGISPQGGNTMLFIVAGALFAGSAVVLRGVMPRDVAAGRQLEVA